MIQVNIYEIKARFSDCLAAALRGERVVIARRNVPVAELTPLPPPRTEPRPLGLGPAEDGYELPDSFWAPLPNDVLSAFNGLADGTPAGSQR